MSNVVLGLDIGIGSCGWALIDFEHERVIGIGAHLWDVPQESKTKVSLATKRRMARSARRNIKRTADRKKHCLRVLKQAGLVPADADKQWMQTQKGDLQPLEVRAAGLDRKLSDREFAQALYNICNRRGYIPHGEGSDSDDAETGKVLTAIGENKKILQDKGYRTVGEMLYREGVEQGFAAGNSRNKGGDYQRCITNEQLLEEVRLLFKAQRELGNAQATAELERTYIEVLTWEKQDPDHDERVYRQVGKCVYFKDEPRAAKACLSFEMCNALERLAHVVYVTPDGAEHKLPPEVRQESLRTLFSPSPLRGNKDCKVRYGDLRKRLDLNAAAYFKNVESDKEKSEEVYKPVVWRKMRGSLPAELMEKLLADRTLADAVGSALAYASTEESLRSKLDVLDLSDEEIEDLCSLPYNTKLFSSYGMRSLKALDLLIDTFLDSEDSVTTLAEAEEASGLKNKRLSDSAVRGTKLPPYIVYDETCKNPVVLRVMGRVRKVVNAVIREYGMPDVIRVELGRDLKRSKKEKDAIRDANNKRAHARDVYREKLAEDLQCDPEAVPVKLLRKYELWIEQDGRDLYQDASIEYERMLHEQHYCQIDHILPYSRTCDDSQHNKILVLAKSNQDKKERSPYEWLEPEGRWEDFEKRVRSLQRYPKKKRDRLLEKDLESKVEGFIKRNMNDTRYATRAALGYVTDYLAFPDDGRAQHTFAVAGGATSACRKAWGFAKKDRELDDCHHAVDAAIIAACDPSAVQAIARAHEQRHKVPKEDREKLFERTEPWEGFTREIEGLAETLIPTRMVDHGGTGRLYEDTVYRYCGLNEKGSKGILSVKGKEGKLSGNYVVRDDGSAVKPDGMAFLRLWWDKTLKVRGKKELGGYLMEPVYYADLAGVAAGSYVPRFVQTSKPRCDWPVVADEALALEPLVLRYGDCIELNGERFRFVGINTSNGAWKLRDMRNLESDVTSGHTLSAAMSRDGLKRIDEDVLGLCHRGAMAGGSADAKK